MTVTPRRRRPDRGRFRDALLLGVLLTLCAVGGAVSLGLLQAHLSPGNALLTRFCPADPTTGADCAAALKTRWSSVVIPIPRLGPGFTPFLGRSNVPVAFLGAAYFAFLGIWFGLLGPARPVGARWRLIPRTIAAAGGVTSLSFVGLMAFTSAPWCVWCLLVHAVNAALVAVVWALTRRPLPISAALIAAIDTPPAALARLVLRPRDALAAMLVALVATGGMWGYWRQARIHRHRLATLRPYAAMIDDLRSDPAFLLREFAAQPVLLRDDLPRRPSEDPSDDRPTLLVFSDFECPACRCHAADLRSRMRAGLDQRVQVLFRHYPLCRTCNPRSRDVHLNACDAARAAEAARLQGGEAAFLSMHDALFAHADRLGPDLYASLARALGLDAERLARDMASPAVRDLVAADVALGAQLGIKGTPTTLLDGRLIPEICDTASFFTVYATQRSTEIARSRSEDAVARSGASP